MDIKTLSRTDTKIMLEALSDLKKKLHVEAAELFIDHDELVNAHVYQSLVALQARLVEHLEKLPY